MKYFLVCFLLIMSCKSVIRDGGNSNVVIGTAANVKGGAILRSNGELYLISGLHSWDSIYLGKKVKVKGSFKFVDGENYHKKIANPLLNALESQTLHTKYYSVSDATWELYDAD